MHPAKVGFAYTIAEKGESVVPFLMSRLKAEKNENSQDAILFVFEIMFNRGLLAGRDDVLEVIRNTVSSMKNPDIKKLSQERLNRVEKARRS